MSGEINKFLGFFKSKFKTEEEKSVTAETASDSVDDSDKIYKNDFFPTRKLFLWGWDEENNPGFLVLYGLHKFKSTNYHDNVLEDNVVYTDYAIFRGKGGHFPSFEAVKIIDNYDYSSRKSVKSMYYKKDIRGYGYWYNADQKLAVEDYRKLKESHSISIPYFTGITYEDCVKAVQSKKLQLDNFRLAETPAEVLQLEESLLPYEVVICELLTNPNLYMRKKFLKELIKSNPPKELYHLILRIGSGELISGLFLEMSHQKNNSLLEEAKDLLQSELNWTSENYSAGVKRCTELYINSFDPAIKALRMGKIRETLSDMDLHLLRINDKKIPDNKVLEGANYRKYSAQGYLTEYSSTYSYEDRKYIRTRRAGLYKKNEYSDGVILNINRLKSTIQEAELYGAADIIGKVAYYLDAPRLTYYFKGNSNYRGLMYFRRYLRRIIDSYGKYDEESYIKAMKALLTSYTEVDYLCKFKGNFQFNYFIKQYLYFDFTEKAPEDWSDRYDWMMTDQLMKLEGRYDYMPEIWDRHFEDVVDIVADAKIEVILKAFYYILKDSDQIANLPYEKLMKPLVAPYKPISDLFKGVLLNRLEQETAFDMEIMIPLMNCPLKEIQTIAVDYFKRTGGKYSAEDLVSFLFFDHPEDWTELFEHSVKELKDEDYLEFLYELFGKSNKFMEQNTVCPESIKEILDNSLTKLMTATLVTKKDLLSFITAELCSNQEIPPFILELMEKVIFTLSFQELADTLDQIEIDSNKHMLSQKAGFIISFLNAIKKKNIPSDSGIMEILETGTSQMIKTLIDAIKEYKDQLNTRFSTLLIMLESEVTALNEIAKTVFEELATEEQKKLHSIIIDSPDKKVYSYGLTKLYELYEKPEETIPEDFVLQMLQHTSPEVKAYISDKMDRIIANLGNGNRDLFMYYVKTLLFLPNRVSVGKENIYKVLPEFVLVYREKQAEIEDMLLDLGSSNIILDSERALVALAKMKKEVISIES